MKNNLMLGILIGALIVSIGFCGGIFLTTKIIEKPQVKNVDVIKNKKSLQTNKTIENNSEKTTNKNITKNQDTTVETEIKKETIQEETPKPNTIQKIDQDQAQTTTPNESKTEFESDPPNDICRQCNGLNCEGVYKDGLCKYCYHRWELTKDNY